MYVSVPTLCCPISRSCCPFYRGGGFFWSSRKQTKGSPKIRVLGSKQQHSSFIAKFTPGPAGSEAPMTALINQPGNTVKLPWQGTQMMVELKTKCWKRDSGRFHVVVPLPSSFAIWVCPHGATVDSATFNILQITKIYFRHFPATGRRALQDTGSWEIKQFNKKAVPAISQVCLWFW